MSDLRRAEAGEPTFEDAYGELAETVQKLEDGGLTLDELLSLFERGMWLVRRCNACLAAAELRVAQIVASPDGEVVLTSFES